MNLILVDACILYVKPKSNYIELSKHGSWNKELIVHANQLESTVIEMFADKVSCNEVQEQTVSACAV
jgi:hypothetical protein